MCDAVVILWKEKFWGMYWNFRSCEFFCIESGIPIHIGIRFEYLKSVHIWFIKLFWYSWIYSFIIIPMANAQLLRRHVLFAWQERPRVRARCPDRIEGLDPEHAPNPTKNYYNSNMNIIIILFFDDYSTSIYLLFLAYAHN